MHRRILYSLTYLAATLSLVHHLDHVIRHNAVGWPLNSEVNAFTMSLIIYPIIITGLLLYRAGRVGPGFWALVSGGGAIFVSAVHFGPYAVEPPAMILDGYDSPIVGLLAFIVLVTFVTVLVVTSLYETWSWWQQHQARRRARLATDRESQPECDSACYAPSGNGPTAIEAALAVPQFAGVRRANRVRESNWKYPGGIRVPTCSGDGLRPLRLMRLSPASMGVVAGESFAPNLGLIRTAADSSAITLRPSPASRKVQHMEDGYTQLGTVLTDQRPEDREGDGVIVVGRFKGDPYDGVQLSYEAGRRNLYLTPEGALRLAFLLGAAVERDIDIR